MTFAGSFGGRLSWSLRCATAPADTMPSIAIISNSSRSNLIISAFFSSCQVPAQEGERDALTRRQQDRRHVFSDEKSNKPRGNSHGFELSRTLSCEEPPKSLDTKRHKDLLFGRLTLT